jgi:aspartyl-tRNA(Asn)/glutamyl-tRNA(Gln) amidotransferase subunit C
MNQRRFPLADYYASLPNSPGASVYMGDISSQDVDRVAELARLDLTEAERVLFADQLNHILRYVDQLQEVDTEGIPPTASVAEVQTAWREDVVRPGLTVEDALANAPEAHNGLFVVPKILGK